VSKGEREALSDVDALGAVKNMGAFTGGGTAGSECDTVTSCGCDSAGGGGKLNVELWCSISEVFCVRVCV
jgi:hypothetical protein